MGEWKMKIWSSYWCVLFSFSCATPLCMGRLDVFRAFAPPPSLPVFTPCFSCPMRFTLSSLTLLYFTLPCYGARYQPSSFLITVLQLTTSFDR
jgi:hypothetical protein